MHKYYFKIKKNDSELEFATDNLEDFDRKVLEWTGTICSPKQDTEKSSEPRRMDFIEVRDLVKINNINKKEDENQVENVNFEEILEETINNPKVDLEESQRKENELNNLYSEKRPKHDIDYLVVTAFYMQFFENMDRFNIKQVNSRIVPLNHPPVTHHTMQECVNHGLVEVVPDLTGLGDVSEYSLTQRGEDYYHNEL